MVPLSPYFPAIRTVQMAIILARPQSRDTWCVLGDDMLAFPAVPRVIDYVVRSQIRTVASI